MKRFLALFPTLLLIFSHLAVAQEQLVNQVVAVINDEVITQGEFDSVFRPIYLELKKNYKGPDFNKRVDEVRLKLLNQMIEDKLVYQEAVRRGIQVSDAEINAQFEAFRKQFPSEDVFQKELKSSGMSIEELKEQFRERVAISRLHQMMIRSKIVVSPVAVERYYKEHGDEFIQKEQAELWSMTLSKSDEAIKKGITDERAKDLADSIIDQLGNGADFADLAKKYSKDSRAEAGGYLGFVKKGMLVSDIDDVVFSLPENTLSNVLETERAYHIFKVGKKVKNKKVTFEEAKPAIEDMLFRKEAHERFVKWMDELKQRSFISIR